MSSLFRARRSEEPRSGGKMLRGKRVTPSASPYARPSESSQAAAQLGSPRWLSGLISGAGKLISSVLPSYGSSASPSSSSSYSSDKEETSSGFNEDEEELQRLNQGGNGSEFVNKCMSRQLATVPTSEAKLVIEQLLMQESFSREECDELTKQIQSRVVDFSAPKVCEDGIGGLRSKTTGNGTLPGALLSSSQRSALPERVPYSSSKMNAFSPGSYLFEACTPDICNKAVSEAKRWLEEKKLLSKPKYDSEYGSCSLNTDMLQYGVESEAASPVDMAKSYMKSLPPWRSPSFSGVGFKTPPPSGMCSFKDEISYENAENSFPSSKGLKRDHLFIRSRDTLDEARQVCPKSTVDKLKIAKSQEIESSARVSEHENSENISESKKRELDCGDPCNDGAFRLPNEKDADANHQFETGNINSSNIVSQQQEIIDAVHPRHVISVPNAHPQEPTQSSDENQPSQNMEELDNVSVPHDTVASASRLMEHYENPSSEIKVIPTENSKSAVPSSSAEVDTDFNHETLSKGTNTVKPQNGTRMKSIERMLKEPQATPSRRGRKVVKSRRGRKS